MLIQRTDFPEGKAHFLIPGPAGVLELKTSHPNGSADRAIVLCHPDPQQEGTMDNKVVHTMNRAFEALGFAVVRFNYRGVGASTGSYGARVGELADAKAVLSWLATSLAPKTVFIGGFSFGSYIACHAAVDLPQVISRLLMIAPSVHYAGFAELHPSQPTTVILAEQDDIAKAGDIRTWVASRKTPVHLEAFPEATHFFHGYLTQLREFIEADFSS